MPFLSVIQVYITPEIMAHALKEKPTEDFMAAVLEDLRFIIRGFIKENSSVNMIYRIYKMLSAGDFAIVIRSERADTSFHISTLLRKRVAVMAEKPCAEKRLVLYKTYTLLTINGNVIPEAEKVGEDDGFPKQTLEKDASEQQHGCFVLRCGFSNCYWSEKQKYDAFMKNRQIKHTIHGLNGRYDFSVIITQDEFIRLFHFIDEYKRAEGSDPGSRISQWKWESSNTDMSIEDYIIYLLKNNYLSCINERYLLGQHKGVVLKTNEVSGFITIDGCPVNAREKFLDYKVNALHNEVLENYRTTCAQVQRISGYRKNMAHYLRLLEKLIHLCQGINGSSDTRIFAAVLLEQLDIITDSINVYTQLFSNGKDDTEIYVQPDLLDLFEDYIRESVCVLDSYAQYIRNNNLQSLQTPNYNLESNTSMEKLLIGYSELLQIFIDFYCIKQAEIDNIRKAEREIPRQYLPVVVPALSKRDVSVEILFQEGIMDDWAEEKAIKEDFLKNEKRSENRFCMAISTPTLMELGNVMTMVTSLFHEVAHQFRYETRKKRNDALLKYCIHRCMHCLAINLLDQLRKELSFIDLTRDFETKIEDYFVQAYLDVNYRHKKEDPEFDYSYQKAPLNNFIWNLRRDTQENLSYWGKSEEIHLAVQEFVKGLSPYYCPGEPEYGKLLEILDGLIEEYIEQENEKKKAVLRKQISKCAYAFAWICACDNLSANIEKPWNIDPADSLDKWMDREEDIAFKKMWEEKFKGITDDEITDNRKIWTLFFRFVCWLYDRLGEGKIDSKKREDFLKEAYKKACAGWKNEKAREDFYNDTNGNLNKVGRALGIDCYTADNYAIFKTCLETAIIQSLDGMEAIISGEIAEYREETADLFMCNVM